MFRVSVFLIRDEPYGVNTTLTVGPTIRLISILIHCVQNRPVIEPTLAQVLVFVLNSLHRRIPQPQTHEAFGPSNQLGSNEQRKIMSIMQKISVMFICSS